MDPDEALAAARAALAEADAAITTADEADALSGAVFHYRALDEWITKGGFLPADWRSRHDKLSERVRALLIDKYGVDLDADKEQT